MPTAQPEYKPLPLAEIAPDPNQPRTNAENDDLTELTAIIKAAGVVTPISVEPWLDDPPEGVSYRIITGERRFHASRLAGLTEIPAIILPAIENADQRIVLQLAENLGRKDLSLADRAASYFRLQSLGLKQAEIATRLGASAPHVSRLLKIARLRGPAADAIQANLVQSENAAIELAKLSDLDIQRLAHAAAKAGRTISLAEIERAAQPKQPREPATPQPPPPPGGFDNLLGPQAAPDSHQGERTYNLRLTEAALLALAQKVLGDSGTHHATEPELLLALVLQELTPAV